MLRISICDDEAYVRKNIRKQILNIINESGVQITEYSDGKELIDDIDEEISFDICLLDLCMDSVGGIEVAKRLRQSVHNKNTLIIFITSYTANISEIVELSPFAYIYKEQIQDVLEKKLRDAIEEINCNSKFLEIICDRKKYRIKISEIFYIEVSGNHVIIHTENKSWETRIYTMKKLVEMEECKEMLRCHNSYLVNYKYVSYMSGEYIKLIDETKIPVSRSYREKVLMYEKG